jgi:3-deoxy-manno-octulosonate cytidylyltransferase (CMP-KDO synthetase)
MEKMKVVGIIPARYASTRFPGKPLAMIGDKPMIQRVYERVSAVLDEVVVATDDHRIFSAVEGFGGKVVMTSEHHQSGTDRCYEAYEQLGRSFDVVVNIQGDEPFIHPSQLHALLACFDSKEVEIATLVRKITTDDGVGFLINPNHPKVVMNRKGNALLFSRSVIPFLRGVAEADYLQVADFYAHIGIYAFRPEVLKEVVSLAPSGLEKAESLEQLRWLENGYTIRCGITTERSVGIDTPEDLLKLNID